MKSVGFFIMVGAEILLYYRVSPIPIFFTPIAWTGYILWLDGWKYQGTRHSLIRSRTREFVWMAVLSVFLWLVFEWYNWTILFNWDYINLPPAWWQFQLGTFWAFATVTPAILETDEWLEWKGQGVPPIGHLIDPRAPFPGWLAWSSGVFGFLCVILPFLVAPETAPHLSAFVWCGFPFLLDPINHALGGRSWIVEIRQGHWGRLGRLFLAGLICGVFWEFWNYWADTKWIYTVPGPLGKWKVFEMPFMGYLGFMAFGVEVWVMWETCRTILSRAFKWESRNLGI